MLAEADDKTARRRAKADWLRALERTAPLNLSSTRTLAQIVDGHARETPDAPALIGEDESLTYGELATRCRRYARWAQAQNLVRGDRVALVMANAPDYAAIWIGLSRLGIVTALINTQITGASLAHALSVAGPKLAIADAAGLTALRDAGCTVVPVFAHGGGDAPRVDLLISGLSDEPLVPDAADTKLSDDALLVYTSGTTGLPKAAHVSHYRVCMWAEWFAGLMNAGPDDRLYDCLPMYHSIGGVVAIGAMLAAGGSVIIRRSFSAGRFWSDVAQSGATIFQYIGELCRYLLATAGHDRPVNSLRLCCGNGLRGDVWTPFQERFAIPRILEFYAATEGTFSLFNVEGKIGSIGRVPPFIAHRSPTAIVRFDTASERPMRGADGLCMRCAVEETGEAIGRIERQGAGLSSRFEGYTDVAESERKILRDVFEPGDVWFRTGDLMRQDAQGFFYFVDRIGDTFRWKGENVSASEVAGAIGRFPGVADAAVYGVVTPGADGRAGMAALVVTDTFDLAAFSQHVRDSLPRYAQPVFLRIGQRIATTGTFRAKKGDLQYEGFDPERVADDLYLWNVDRATYLPLDSATHARIASGLMRL